jgi:hypothetical protein
MEQHVTVGLDELNSGATKEVVSQISQQSVSTGRSWLPVCLKKNLHRAEDNEAGSWGMGFSIGRNKNNILQ